jgi:hypothetical protein
MAYTFAIKRILLISSCLRKKEFLDIKTGCSQFWVGF